MRLQPILLIIFCITLTYSFEELHEQNRIMMFYEQNSAKPILHLYFNRHFKNSTQFKDFENIITQLYNDHEDYLNILYTDCNQDKQLALSNCQKMSKTKDNRQITGSMPSGQFRRLGDKLIQNPPSTLIFQHTRDVYSYDQLKQFVISLIPNFYQQINNVEQYEDYLAPRYSPKLIAFITDQQQIPLTLRQIAVTYFLKFDFAFISDLNQQLLKLFKVKKFPSFVIVKYNFNQSKYQHYYSQKLDLSEQNYHEVKQFVDGHALQQHRNDLLFHKISMESKSEIYTFQTLGELQEFKQKASGWIIIERSDGKTPQKLLNFKTKYDKYFSYVNLVQEPFGQIKLYNPQQNRQFPMQEDLQFNSLNFQDFRSNMTILLTKDTVILGVSEDYAHICGIAQKQLFRGHVRCLIISNQGKKDLEQFMKIEFKIGFIARTQLSTKNKSPHKQTKGTKIMQDKFELIYQQLDWATRHKIKQTLDQYLEKPVSQPKDGLTVQQACFHPFKKCLFLLTNLGKQDRTLQEYLKQIAFDYMNNFIIYELDIQKNEDLIKKIGGIKDKKAQLLVYIPRTEQIVRLNKKVTKNIIGQFMKANLKNDKRLKKQLIEQFNKIILHSRSSDKQDVSEKGQYAEQL